MTNFDKVNDRRDKLYAGISYKFEIFYLFRLSIKYACQYRPLLFHNCFVVFFKQNRKIFGLKIVHGQSI